MIIDISLHVVLPAYVVLLRAAHTFCVSVLYVHAVFDEKHILMRASARVCVDPRFCIYIYMCVFILIIDFCFSVFWCPFQHGLYKCTCTLHTVAHCILS